MGYCKHEWQSRNEQLRAVFNGVERTVHDFYVCRRCLKIREVEPDSRPLPARENEGSNAA